MRDLLAFPNASRVWIFQADKPFRKEELEEANEYVQRFVKDWTSHNNLLKATGGILHDHFVVLVVDETRAGASGCSIDKSVHFIQSLEQHYSKSLFDRMTFAYLKDEEIHLVHKNELRALYDSGEIDDQTLFFDNLVKDKGTFLANWVVPLKQSWHYRML